MPIEEIRFVANPMQKLFIEHRPFKGFKRPDDWPSDVSPRVVDLFSSRMGEGKSAGLVMAVWFYTLHNPGANCVIIRDTWVNVRDTTQKEFFKWFPEDIAGRYLKSEKLFTWNKDVTGLEGTVTFMGMDDEADATKLQSRFYGMFGMDEPSPAAGTGGIHKTVFTTALTRLRQPGMQWYAAKLAQNNPDESHWTYEMFVEPGTEGFTHFQTQTPENISHLPPGYYEQMAKDLSDRPDLQRRFVQGEFGFQQLGQPVCPLWNDQTHLAVGLEPMKGLDLWLSWDGGLTPVCVISQVHPSGVLMVLDAISETHGGTYQLIEDQVIPLLETRYADCLTRIKHTGDPTLETPDQSNSNNSPVRQIKKLIGGSWRKGAKELAPRVDPLNRRLSLLGPAGKGMVIVDRQRAKGVWHALRGGWHYPVHSGGNVGASPVKNHPHSDFGDAIGYLCGTLFPRGEVRGGRKNAYPTPESASYGSAGPGGGRSIRQKRLRLPEEFREIR